VGHIALGVRGNAGGGYTPPAGTSCTRERQRMVTVGYPRTIEGAQAVAPVRRRPSTPKD